MAIPMAATCHRCGYRMDATGEITGGSALPQDGSWSVCLACGELAAFVSNGFGWSLRPMTAEERAEALADDGVVRALLTRQVLADGDANWPGRRSD